MLAACGGSPAPVVDTAPSTPLGGPAILVANKAEDTVSMHALPDGEELARVPTGDGPHEIAVAPDGRTAVVSNYGEQVPGHTLTVIDLETRTVKATLELGDHRRPHGIAYLPDGRRVVVTVEMSQAVLIVDVEAGTVVRAIRTDQEGSHMLALAPGGARAYVASIGSGTLQSVDLLAMTAGEPVAVAPATEAIAVAPDGGEVWTSSLKDNVIVVLDADLVEKARIPAAGAPIRITPTPDGTAMLVTNVQGSVVQVVDTAGHAVTPIAMAPQPGIGPTAAPLGTAVATDARTAYVSLIAEDRVAVIDLATRALTGHVPTGRGPDGLAYVAAMPAPSP